MTPIKIKDSGAGRIDKDPHAHKHKPPVVAKLTEPRTRQRKLGGLSQINSTWRGSGRTHNPTE